MKIAIENETATNNFLKTSSDNDIDSSNSGTNSSNDYSTNDSTINVSGQDSVSLPKDELLAQVLSGL